MPITCISVTNFKSFREMSFHPDSFTILIGSNASGKSNLIQVFIFLRDIAKYGIGNAISLQGGVDYLRNTVIGPAEEFSFKIEYTLEERKKEVIGVREHAPIYFEPRHLVYEFSLRFTDTQAGYEIPKDQLEINGDFFGPLTPGAEDRAGVYEIIPPGRRDPV